MGTVTIDKLNEETLKQHIKTTELGKTLHFFSSIDSTNTVAKDLADKGAPHGTLVIAETQTRGKGRLGRSWHSPAGGLWFSLVLRPNNILPSHMIFICGLGIAQIFQKAGLDISLRWPNDIYHQNKKLGGILSETKFKGEHCEYLVMGLGLNINIDETAFPPQLREEATSFLILKKKPVSRSALLAHILLAWEKLLLIYPKQGFAPILKAWKKYASFLGSQVRVDTSSESLEGEAVDITLTGALRVQDIDGLIHEVSTGDVRKVW